MLKHYAVIERKLTLYTKAVNKEREGQNALNNYKKRIAAIKGQLGDKINSKVSIIRFVPGDVRSYQKIHSQVLY